METYDPLQFVPGIAFPQARLTTPQDLAKAAEENEWELKRQEIERQYTYTKEEVWEAAEQEATTGRVRRILGDKWGLFTDEEPFNYTPDEAWAPPPAEDLLKTLDEEGIPRKYAADLMQTVNPQHFEKLKKNIKDSVTRQQILSENLGRSIAAEFMDPINLGIGLMSGGAGVLAKAGRVKNIISQALANGAIEAGIAGVAAYDDPTRSMTDSMLYSFGFGATLGGAIGGLTARPARVLRAIEAEAKQGKRIDDSMALAIENETYLQDIARLDAEIRGLDNQMGVLEGPVEARAVERLEGLVSRRDELIGRLRAAEDSKKAADIDAAWSARATAETQGLADDLLMMSRNERLAEEGYSLGDLEAQATELVGSLRAAEPAPENALQAAMREAGMARKQTPEVDPVAIQRELAEVEEELKDLATRASNHELKLKLKRQERSYLEARKADLLSEMKLKQLGENKPRDPEDPDAFLFEDSAGAARRAGTDITEAVEGTKAMPEDLDSIPYSWGGMVMRWFDSAGFLGSQKNPFFRWLGRLGEDGVGLTKGGKAAAFSAEERANQIRQRTYVAWRREVDKAFDEFDAGQPFLGKDLRREQFMREVSNAYESHLPVNNPQMEKAVGATRGFFQTYAKELKASGVRYAQNMEIRTDYLPHIQDVESINKLLTEFQSGQVNDMIYGSIRRWADRENIYEEYAQILYAEKLADMKAKQGMEKASKVGGDNPKFDPDVLLEQARVEAREGLDKMYRRIADGYLQNIRDYGKWRDEITFHGLSFHDRGAFQALMEKFGLSKEEIEKFANIFGIASEGKPARFKSRVNFDMDYKTQMRSIEDGTMKPVSITQLFHRNLDSITELYGRQVAGHIGLAKEMGIYGKGDFEELKRKAVEWHNKEGVALGVKENDLKRSLAHAEYLYKAVVGAPLEEAPAGFGSTWLRRMRDLNTMRLMGQVGFAQVAEFGRLLGTAGVPAMIKQMPAFKDIIQLAGTKRLDNQFLRELEAMLGTGTHALQNKVFTKLTEFDEMGARMDDQIDRVLHKGKHWVGNLSLMNQITTMQQRMAAAAMGQRLADLSLKGKLSAGDLRELASYGMSEEMLPRVMAGLKQHTKRGSNGRVHLLQLDKWDDIDAAATLEMSLGRAVRRIIQENAYGGTFPLMHTALGKVLFQFRSFMMNSLTKQFMNGIALHNAQTYAAVAQSMFFGTLAYVAQSNLNWWHDPEKLAEELSIGEIAKSAVQRSGYTGWAAPLIDQAVQTASMGTLEGPFAGKRSTQGLGTGFIAGNPTVNLFETAVKGVFGPLNAAVNPDYDLSQQDFKNLTSVLPYANTMYLRSPLAFMLQESGLPQYSTRMSR